MHWFIWNDHFQCSVQKRLDRSSREWWGVSQKATAKRQGELSGEGEKEENECIQDTLGWTPETKL